MILFFKSVILTAIVLSFYGCQQKSPLEIEIERLLNSQLNIPQNMKEQFIGNNIETKWSHENLNLKILTVINGNCSSCIQSLESWNELLKEREFSPSNIGYYFLIESEDDFISFNSFNEQNDLIDYPLIIDHKSSFFESMNLSYNTTLQTFLLDAKDNILLVGNPTHAPPIKELYKAKIKEKLNL